MRQELTKTFDVKALLALGLGCVVGWSWVIYGGMWTTIGGSVGGIIAFLLVALFCSFISLTYAELSSIYPHAGGEVVFCLESMGMGVARITQWMGLLGWLGLVAVEAISIPVILNTVGFYIPQAIPLYMFGGERVYLSYILFSIGLNFVFAMINILGAKLSAKVQTIAVYALILAAIFFFISGVSLGDVKNFEPAFTTPQAMFTVLIMLPGFMAGFQAIPQAAEEGLMPHKMVGRIIVMTIWAAAIFYLLIVIGLAFAAPVETRSGNGIIVLEAVSLMFNGNIFARLLVAIAALLGMLTTWNAAYVAASRLLVGLGRAKMLPSFFADIHDKFQTPHKSIIFVFVLSSLFVFMGSNMRVFALIANSLSLNVVLIWTLTVISFIRLRKIKPDLERPYEVKNSKVVGAIALVLCIAFICLYLPFSPSALQPLEWGVLGTYAIFALVFDRIWFSRDKTPLEERRALLGLTQVKEDLEN